MCQNLSLICRLARFGGSLPLMTLLMIKMLLTSNDFSSQKMCDLLLSGISCSFSLNWPVNTSLSGIAQGNLLNLAD